MYVTALALWAVFLAVASLYTNRARNPRTRPLAAYLIFAATFTMSSFVIFVVIIAALSAFGRLQALTDPISAALFLVVVFVPPLLIARWQLRKPPAPTRAARPVAQAASYRRRNGPHPETAHVRSMIVLVPRSETRAM